MTCSFQDSANAPFNAVARRNSSEEFTSSENQITPGNAHQDLSSRKQKYLEKRRCPKEYDVTIFLKRDFEVRVCARTRLPFAHNSTNAMEFSIRGFVRIHQVPTKSPSRQSLKFRASARQRRVSAHYGDAPRNGHLRRMIRCSCVL